jgi:hypothetical protein
MPGQRLGEKSPIPLYAPVVEYNGQIPELQGGHLRLLPKSSTVITTRVGSSTLYQRWEFVQPQSADGRFSSGNGMSVWVAAVENGTEFTHRENPVQVFENFLAAQEIYTGLVKKYGDESTWYGNPYTVDQAYEVIRDMAFRAMRGDQPQPEDELRRTAAAYEVIRQDREALLAIEPLMEQKRRSQLTREKREWEALYTVM